MKKIILCTLFFILALGFVPTSAVTIPTEYETYIDTINGTGFWFKDFPNKQGNTDYQGLMYYPPNSVTWCVYAANSFSFDTSYPYCIPIYTINITSQDEVYSFSTNITNAELLSQFGNNGNRFYKQGVVYHNGFNYNGDSPYIYNASYSGTLAQCLEQIAAHFRNVNIYVDGVQWASVEDSYSIETEIELPCDIQAVDSSFNFFNGGYGLTWKQGQYNWTQTGPLENVTRTMVWTVSYPTVSYVQSLYNQSFVDSTPLDVVRNAFNTVFNSGTSIYDIPEQYRATTNFFINIDSPELGSSYHTSYDSTTQQWSLTQNEYSYSLANGYQFNTGFFQQLYQLYGDADLFSIALCYITPVRVSMYAVDDTQGIIYNPLSIYWLDLKQSNGTVLEYRNFGSQTTVTDDNVTDDTTINDSVTGDDSPFVNPTEEQLNTNYNNSIQNSYNHTVNNYYNYNDINTDLLDYYLSFRDGGTEEDVQDAFGYLNATISSLSNVPVVLHNLFYNFFPLPVIRLMQALFIVFMVFMIIIIIKHLFR